MGYRFNPSGDSGQQEEFEQNAFFSSSGQQFTWPWSQEEKDENTMPPDNPWLFSEEFTNTPAEPEANNESTVFRRQQPEIIRQQSDEQSQQQQSDEQSQQREFGSQWAVPEEEEEEEKEARQSEDEQREFRRGDEDGIQSPLDKFVPDADADADTERLEQDNVDGGLTGPTTEYPVPTARPRSRGGFASSSPDPVSVSGSSHRQDKAGLGLAVHRGSFTEFNTDYAGDLARPVQADLRERHRDERGPHRAASNQQQQHQQWSSGGEGAVHDQPSRAHSDDCTNNEYDNTQPQVRHTAGRQSVLVHYYIDALCFRPESQEGTGPRLMEDKKLTMTSTSNTSNTSNTSR